MNRWNLQLKPFINAKTPRETNKDAMIALEANLLSNTARSRCLEAIKTDEQQNLKLLVLAFIRSYLSLSAFNLCFCLEKQISWRSLL